MSENVYLKGTVVKELRTAQEICLAEFGIEDLNRPYIETWGEMLSSVSDDYILNTFDDSGDIYKFIDKSWEDPSEDSFMSSKNSDGTVDIELRYYNGGCSLREAVQTALERGDK